jgi:hypothetical protein
MNKVWVWKRILIAIGFTLLLIYLMLQCYANLISKNVIIDTKERPWIIISCGQNWN